MHDLFKKSLFSLTVLSSFGFAQDQQSTGNTLTVSGKLTQAACSLVSVEYELRDFTLEEVRSRKTLYPYTEYIHPAPAGLINCTGNENATLRFGFKDDKSGHIPLDSGTGMATGMTLVFSSRGGGEFFHTSASKSNFQAYYARQGFQVTMRGIYDDNDMPIATAGKIRGVLPVTLTLL